MKKLFFFISLITIICSCSQGGSSGRDTEDDSVEGDSMYLDTMEMYDGDSVYYYDEGYDDEYEDYNEEELEVAYEDLYEDEELHPVEPIIPPSLPDIEVHDNTIKNKYYNYKETSNCVEGVVVYEGRGDYYIVETNLGYTVAETFSGFLSEDDRVRGELNKFGFTYLIKKSTDSEVKVYIEDYMLTDKNALKWLGRHNHLKYNDQQVYDNSDELNW